MNKSLKYTQVLEKMSDRNPDTGESFPSVLAMREAKLRDWQAHSFKLKFKRIIAT